MTTKENMNAPTADRDSGAELRPLNGVPTLFINGEPQGPMSFQWGLERWPFDVTQAGKGQHMAAAGQAGIAIHFIRIGWRNPADFGAVLAEFDGCVQIMLKAVPNAHIIPWIIIWPYAEFADQHPDEVIAFDDGRTGPWTQSQVHGPGGPRTPRATPGPPRPGGTRIPSSSPALCVTAMRPPTMSTSWVTSSSRSASRPATSGIGTRRHRSMDYSPAMQRYFRRWLRQEYAGDVQALRAAWNDGEVSFETRRTTGDRAEEPRRLWLLLGSCPEPPGHGLLPRA